MIKIQDIEHGFTEWSAKPHNAKWVKRIDGTPIGNDIVACIFEHLSSLECSTAPAASNWKCGAIAQGTAGGNDPADCDYPHCGCDPNYAAPVSPDATGKCGELVTVVDRYRKKSFEVEAIQYTGENLEQVLAFTGKHPSWDGWFKSFDDYFKHVSSDGFKFKIIGGPYGTEIAVPGDWIIKRDGGRATVCKPFTFADQFEAIVTRSQAVELLAAKDERLKEWQNKWAQTDILRLKAEADNAALTARVEELEDKRIEDRFTVVDEMEKREALEAKLAAAEKALEPFAACCDHIRDDEDDEEWAKFRLLVKDYRRARAAVKA